ncbi:MAG TPA: beta-ketoacyl-[acyl-carrier-protein] synthase II [Bacteroidetes bacterium]|nr:beta-ketoacyl-[acyl-carrier-protein] synthase II [Bacteroidota bacterium]
MRRVVITGIGALTPIGNGIEEYKKGLYEGRSGANIITYFDIEDFKVKFAAELKNFNPDDYLERKVWRKLDPFARYAMVTTQEAMEDSGIHIEEIDPDRAGVIWGSGIGGFNSIEEEITKDVKRGAGPKFSPFLIPKLIPDIVPGHISIKYGFKGINYATVAACASASMAITNSFDYIRFGKADVMITGGSEAAVTRTSIGGFSSMKALSQRNDDPLTGSRPFDLDRDGFVLGEGSGTIILEEYEHAKKRGAKIYGEIVGAAMSADAYHITAPHPEGEGAKKVMSNALSDAGINTSDIDYINVHGTSTPLGDKAETLAIKRLFGQDAYKLNISSTKSMTGHLLGAAGAVELIASIFAINDSLIPPTINHFTDDPDIDPKLNLTFWKPQERNVEYAMSNTFGFGGHNSSIILKKFAG